MKLKQIALTLLTARDYSRHELSQKLLKRGFTQEDVQTALSDLESAGLLNDANYINNYIQQLYNKGYGPQRIALALKQKGLMQDIEQINAVTDNAWHENLKKTWQKRFKGVYPTTLKERAKQFRFLQYRGFTQDQINTFFKTENYDD